MRKVFMRVLLCSLIFSVATACHRAPDESRVREGVEAAAHAARQVDAAGLGDVLSDDFDGNAGVTDRRQLMGLLRAAAFRDETIRALVGPVEVEPRGERYVARFTVTLSSGGKLWPAQMSVYKVETAWRKEEREWRCYSATWSPSL